MRGKAPQELWPGLFFSSSQSINIATKVHFAKATSRSRYRQGLFDRPLACCYPHGNINTSFPHLIDPQAELPQDQPHILLKVGDNHVDRLQLENGPNLAIFQVKINNAGLTPLPLSHPS
jgi:hypothetical protein